MIKKYLLIFLLIIVQVQYNYSKPRLNPRGDEVSTQKDKVITDTINKKKDIDIQKANYDLGKNLLMDNHPKDALKYLERAALVDGPLNDDILYTLIALHVKNKNELKAREIALGFPEIEKRSKALFVFAKSLEKSNKIKALEVYSEIIHNYPHDLHSAGAILNSAYLYLSQKDFYSVQTNLINLLNNYTHPYYNILPRVYYFAGIFYSSPGPFFDRRKAKYYFTAFWKGPLAKRFDFKNSQWKDAAAKQLHFISSYE